MNFSSPQQPDQVPICLFVCGEQHYKTQPVMVQVDNVAQCESSKNYFYYYSLVEL